MQQVRPIGCRQENRSPIAVGGSAVLLLLVWMVYRLAMPILIERMSA
jgi:hypothetical protein